MTTEPDPYQVLGVRPGATISEIRAAYAAAIQKLAPVAGTQLSPLADAHLNLLDASFHLLSQPESRARYDAMRSTARPSEPPDPQPRDGPPSPTPTVSSSALPDQKDAIKFGNGISHFAWMGLAIAVVALGRVMLGATPTHWPSATGGAPAVTESGASASAAEQAVSGAFIEWKATDGGDPQSYNVEDLVITLSTDRGEGGQRPRPKITVVDGSGESITAVGQENPQLTAARFGVGKIDAQSRDNQVFFLTYSGGAHCCTSVVLLEKGKAGWRETDLGSWDGEPLSAFPKDIDGDGTPDLVFNDQRFAYTFSPYAMSFMPPRVFNVIGGRSVEVSGEPRYRKLFEDQLDAAKNGCLSHNNGACAGYVAIASRLGQRDDAWQIMLQSYDQSTGWSLPSACRTIEVNGVCPKDEGITFKSYPAALAWFLVDAGYPYWTPTSIPADINRAPSFDCIRVTSVNLKLVCATPTLSAADRVLAALYQADLSSSPDPSALQADERSWIQQRNLAPPDIDILQQLYDARLAALRGPDSDQSAMQYPLPSAPAYTSAVPTTQNPSGLFARNVAPYRTNDSFGSRPYFAGHPSLAPPAPPHWRH
jgi:hypothetical protein